MYTIRFANTDDAETLAIIHSRSWNAAYKKYRAGRKYWRK